MRVLRSAVLAAVLIGAGLPALAEEPASVEIPRLRGTPSELAPEEKGPRRLIRFLTSTDFPPFQFLKPDQTPAGFNVDVARAICAELEFQCTLQALPWDELTEALENGRADALIAGYRPTAELRLKSDLTRPYFRLPARFAVKKGAETADVTPASLSGKKVAVVGGSAHEAFLQAFFPNAELAGFADSDAARAALKEGQADALFGDAAGLSLWLAGSGSDGCCAFTGGPYYESRFFGEGLVIAVRKSDTRLRQDLDRTLDRIEDNGVLGDIYLRWFPIGIF